MFAITNRAVEHFLNFFKSKDDTEVIEFCQAEYKNDWKAAYITWKEEGRMPNFHRRSI